MMGNQKWQTNNLWFARTLMFSKCRTGPIYIDRTPGVEEKPFRQSFHILLNELGTPTIPTHFLGLVISRKKNTSWWLNQSIWKTCNRQIGSFPLGSGWKLENKLKPPPRTRNMQQNVPSNAWGPSMRANAVTFGWIFSPPPETERMSLEKRPCLKEMSSFPTSNLQDNMLVFRGVPHGSCSYFYAKNHGISSHWWFGDPKNPCKKHFLNPSFWEGLPVILGVTSSASSC